MSGSGAKAGVELSRGTACGIKSTLFSHDDGNEAGEFASNESHSKCSLVTDAAQHGDADDMLGRGTESTTSPAQRLTWTSGSATQIPSG